MPTIAVEVQVDSTIEDYGIKYSVLYHIHDSAFDMDNPPESGFDIELKELMAAGDDEDRISVHNLYSKYDR